MTSDHFEFLVDPVVERAALAIAKGCDWRESPDLRALGAPAIPDERPPLDRLDAALVTVRRWRRLERHGTTPLVGDVVEGYGRVTHDWGDGCQTGRGGSYYLNGSGLASYSGGLDPTIPLERFVLTDRFEPARFWIYHHDMGGAHRGVGFRLLVQVWTVAPDETA